MKYISGICNSYVNYICFTYQLYVISSFSISVRTAVITTICNSKGFLKISCTTLWWTPLYTSFAHTKALVSDFFRVVTFVHFSPPVENVDIYRTYWVHGKIGSIVSITHHPTWAERSRSGSEIVPSRTRKIWDRMIAKGFHVTTTCPILLVVYIE